MIQFDFNRFGKLAKWTLTNDKRYFVKSFLQMFVILLLIFLFFTMVVKINGGYLGAYKSCAVAMIAVLVTNIVVGPALMFYSMEGRHDMQTLMMLPASSFEKYMVRYAHWLVLLPLYIVAILGADLLQYLVHLVAEHDYARFVTAVLIDLISGGISHFYGSLSRFVTTLIVIIIWFQSLYAVGATLFRSRKFNWVITTIVIILIGVLFYKIGDKIEAVQLNDHSTLFDYVVGIGFYLVWAMINYWLSYRFFCRTQVIGKFVNL